MSPPVADRSRDGVTRLTYGQKMPSGDGARWPSPILASARRLLWTTIILERHGFPLCSSTFLFYDLKIGNQAGNLNG
jgi:hypothetical protein